MRLRKKKSAEGAINSAAHVFRFASKSDRHGRSDDCPHASAVKTRRMTQEEERQLEAVLDLFLAEIVREHFER